MRSLLLLCLIPFASACAQTVWTQRPAPEHPALSFPAGRPGLYMIRAEDFGPYRHLFLRSTDAVNWGDVTSLPECWGLVCLNNRFLGYSSEGLWISDDGLAATPAYTPTANENFDPRAVAYGNGAWVVADGDGSLYYSIDNAASWRTAISPAGSLKSVAFGNGTFVASNGSGIITSPNGIDWAARPTPSVTVGDPLVYAAGRFQTPTAYSTDGIAWIAVTVANPTGDIIAGASNFLTFNGSIFYTSITDEWTQTKAPVIGDTIVAAALCGDHWIAATNAGKVLTAPIASLPPPVAPPLSVAPAVRLTWPSQTGRTYFIQRSPNNSAWTDHTGQMQGTGGIMEWLAPASGAREFFRVQVR